MRKRDPVPPRPAYSTMRLSFAQRLNPDPPRGGLRGHRDFLAVEGRDHLARLPCRLAHHLDFQKAGKRELSYGASLDMTLDEHSEFIEHQGHFLLLKPRGIGQRVQYPGFGHRLPERRVPPVCRFRHLTSPLIVSG